MSIDASTIPINPVFVLTAAAVVAIFALGVAPEVARREIARSDWQSICEAEIKSDIAATRRPDQVIPTTPDTCGLATEIFAPDLKGLCLFVPDPHAAARATERRLRQAEEARISRVVQGITDRCFCSEIVFVEEERWPLTWYAMTGRALSNPSIRNREAALSKALHSPTCVMEG